MHKYNVTEDEVVYMQISFRQLENKYISDLVFDNKAFKPKDLTTLNKQVKILPLTTVNTFLGKPLEKIVHEGVVTSIKYNIENKYFGFIEVVNEQNSVLTIKGNSKPIGLNANCNFYICDVTSPNYILITKNINNTILKEAFNLNGVKIDSIIDTVLHSKVINRQIKNKQLTILNNTVTNISEKLNTSPRSNNVIKNTITAPV